MSNDEYGKFTARTIFKPTNSFIEDIETIKKMI